MKKLFLASYLFIISITFVPCFAQQSRGEYGDDPMIIVDKVVKKANTEYKIQQSALDGATDTQGSYQSQYKIANTLDWLRNNIAPYMQWAVYIGLSFAGILLIYNGFLMVTNSIHGAGDMSKVKKNIMYIVIGVLLLTGFYVVIRLMAALLAAVFGGGGSGLV